MTRIEKLVCVACAGAMLLLDLRMALGMAVGLVLAVVALEALDG